MTKWLTDAIPFLEQSDYEKVVNLYEEIIDNQPQEINNYWYLGLAYLFCNRKEDAKAIWFMPFFELEEKNNHEDLQQSLLKVLIKEAQRQSELKNYQFSLSIREEIKEILPNDVNNLLHLLNLSFFLNQFQEQNIHDWYLIELIRSSKKENIDFNLIYEVLDKVLQFPLGESVQLAEAILVNQDGDGQFIDLIINKAHYMGYNQKFFSYSAGLGELCLKYQPQNLVFLNGIYWYYLFSRQYDESLKIAHAFYNYSKTEAQKVLGSYFILHSTLTEGNWTNFSEMAQRHQYLLTKLPTNAEQVVDKCIRESLIVVSQPLLYLKDKPREKRLIINQVSALFQQISQADYSCPVNFSPNINYSKSRKLKIGYIGSTLRGHSVGWLSRWLMEYHNQENFAIHTYFIGQQGDEVTKKWFIDRVDKSASFDQDINKIITTIEQDEIDILIDLDSFTHNVTAMIMALKPAPIQVAWLGMDTTGIPAIDYFIADPYVLPEDAQEYYQEKIWRLPHTYLSVDGFEIDVPNISRENLDIPASAIIYINIQNALKRHPDIIHAQMKIIKSVSNSYLLIKGNGNQERLKNLFINIAETEGVAQDKLRFLEQTSTEETHRANLKIADVVLDTYPYNGATTTLETLWMEIPLVTRVGEQFAARNSYTFMMNAGITEGIAFSDQEYIEWGIKLGKDENLRKEISWKLKQSKKTSPLWNGKQFTREMEKAYQQMWEIYVKEKEGKEQI